MGVFDGDCFLFFLKLEFAGVASLTEGLVKGTVLTKWRQNPAVNIHFEPSNSYKMEIIPPKSLSCDRVWPTAWNRQQTTRWVLVKEKETMEEKAETEKKEKAVRQLGWRTESSCLVYALR